jgi:hypothetical protein
LLDTIKAVESYTQSGVVPTRIASSMIQDLGVELLGADTSLLHQDGQLTEIGQYLAFSAMRLHDKTNLLQLHFAYRQLDLFEVSYKH